jgi:2-hydroxy-6-oxonona-2,4-dienedioate hydrolase
MTATIGAGEPLVSVYDDVNGVRVHALVSTRAFADGRTRLVFVHGLGASVRYLEPTMIALAGEHPLVGVDLPGFGRSGSPRRALDTAQLASALCDWLDVRGIGPAIFIGNSFGCQVIVELAYRDPMRVLGLVLNAPTMDPAHRSVLGLFVRFLADMPHEPWGLVWLVARDYFRAGPVRFFQTLRWALADHIEEKLPHIGAPTLIVCGARDPVVTVAWAADATRLVGISSSGSAGATLSVVPTAAHALPYDAPSTFASLIEDFVKQSLRRARPA